MTDFEKGKVNRRPLRVSRLISRFIYFYSHRCFADWYLIVLGSIPNGAGTML